MTGRPGKRWFAASAVLLVLLGLAHVAAIFGGANWYASLGAPDDIVRMARAGKRFPETVSLLIALVCLLWASYAFSGAGLVRRLPLLRTVLALLAAGMIARAVGFIAVLAVSPNALALVCNCRGIDAMVITTSAICLAIGAGITVGLQREWHLPKLK